MRAGFIFNDVRMSLLDLDLIVCAPTFLPEIIRGRPDVKATAKIGVYTNLEIANPRPYGGLDSFESRVWRRIGFAKYLLSERASGADRESGWIEFETVDHYSRVAFSSYPWPKAGTDERRDRVDLKLSFDRLRVHVDAIAEEIDSGWDFVYIDQFTPMKPYLFERYRAASALPDLDPEFAYWSARREYLWRFAAARLRSKISIPLLGNTAGWTTAELDGITIESPNGAVGLAAFGRAQEFAVRNGRVRPGETLNVAWDGSMEADGLVMRGEYLSA